MVKKKIFMYFFIILGFITIIICMFKPFSDTENRISASVIVAIMVCFFYYSFNVRTIFEDDTEESKVNEKASEIKIKTQEDYFSEITDKIPDFSNKNITIEENFNLALNFLCSNFSFSQGIIFKTFFDSNDNKALKKIATYAYSGDENNVQDIIFGDGITGQAAQNNEFIYLDEIPKGILKIVSGLGESYPDMLVIAPMIDKNQNVIGIIELAGFGSISKEKLSFLKLTIDQISSKTHFLTL